MEERGRDRLPENVSCQSKHARHTSWNEQAQAHTQAHTLTRKPLQALAPGVLARCLAGINAWPHLLRRRIHRRELACAKACGPQAC